MSLLPALTSSPKGALGRFLLDMDVRPKILLALLTGLSLWRLPDVALPVLALGAGLLLFSLGGFARVYLRLWKGGAAFVLAWTALKFLLDLLGPVAATTALTAAAGLGMRLTTLLLLGLTLALSATPHALGLGLAWFLRPVLGQQAWRVAMALALMIHFLPLTWTSAAGLLQNLSRRWPDCPWHRRIRLVSQALLRVMSQSTWKQTLALAARGLDRPGAWRLDQPIRIMQWAAALVPGLALLALAACR